MRFLILATLIACAPAPTHDVVVSITPASTVDSLIQDDLCDAYYWDGYTVATDDWLECEWTQQPLDGGEGYLVDCWISGYTDAYLFLEWRSDDDAACSG